MAEARRVPVSTRVGSAASHDGREDLSRHDVQFIERELHADLQPREGRKLARLLRL
jgi:hypothetical protein